MERTESKLIIWDFDGTLVDSRMTSLEIYNQLASEMGLKPVDDPNRVRGMTSREFFQTHRISFWRLPRLVRRFQESFARVADQVPLFPGVSEVLTRLVSARIRLGILSSNREDNIRKCLRANGVEAHFAFVVGHPSLFGKARLLRRISRAERIAPEAVVYVGDEVRDIEAAHRAGIRSVAVVWGFHQQELLRGARPTHMITEPHQLLDQLQIPPAEG